MAEHGNVAERSVVRTVRVVGEEMAGGMHVAVWWYGHDDEGMSTEGAHLSATLQLPVVETDVDHAWLVLMAAIRLLEDAGSVGRVNGTRRGHSDR